MMMRAILLLVLVPACTSSPTVAVPYDADFSAPLGAEWTTRGGGWRTVDGRLFNDGAHNVPLWLRAALPDDVRVTFTAESKSPAVDLKCEIFGDGEDHQSGYVVILSGWDNTKSIIARLDEHGPPRTPKMTEALVAEVAKDPQAAAARYADRREVIARPHHGQMGHAYRFRIERRDHWLRFFVDDALHLEYFDPAPLRGRGHDRFAFNNWASIVTFDDLKIEPL